MFRKPSSDEVSITLTVGDAAYDVIDAENTVDQSSYGVGKAKTNEFPEELPSSDEPFDHDNLASKIYGKF